MKLSFVTLGCPDWSIERIAKMASEYGYDGVELRAKGDKHVDVSLSSEERKNIRNLFKQYHLEIPCLAGYSRFNSMKEEELEQNRKLLLDNIILARDLGTPLIRTFIGVTPEGARAEDVIKNGAQYLSDCGEIALKEGVGIVLESHDDYCHGTTLKNVFDLIKSDNVGVLWDLENNHQQKESPENFFKYVGNKIRHLHVRDSFLKEDGKNQICLTGKGAVPLKESIGILNRTGYKGYLSFEWEKMWHMELEEPEVAFPQFIEYMKSI